MKAKSTSNSPRARTERAKPRSVQRVVGLPPEWNTFIPPTMVNTVEAHCGSMVGTGPKWNPQWLAGLEKYVRAIVQDELRQANDPSSATATEVGVERKGDNG